MIVVASCFLDVFELSFDVEQKLLLGLCVVFDLFYDGLLHVYVFLN